MSICLVPSQDELGKVACMVYSIYLQTGNYYSYHFSFGKMNFSLMYLLKCQLVFAQEAPNLLACEEWKQVTERGHRMSLKICDLSDRQQ